MGVLQGWGDQAETLSNFSSKFGVSAQLLGCGHFQALSIRLLSYCRIILLTCCFNSITAAASVCSVAGTRVASSRIAVVM